MIAPFVSAPGNRNESPLLREALPEVMHIARDVGMGLEGSIVSLDGVYDCRANRKAILNRGMIPNINRNVRGRKQSKRGHKPWFDPAIFEERFRTIERVFAWEDKFRGSCFASIASVSCTTRSRRLPIRYQSPALLSELIRWRLSDFSFGEVAPRYCLYADAEKHPVWHKTAHPPDCHAQLSCCIFNVRRTTNDADKTRNQLMV